MATNQFLPFATDPAAFVRTYAQWLASTERPKGWKPGLLEKEDANTPTRQAAFVAYALSQWTVDQTGSDQLDNGVAADWIAVFEAALSAFITDFNGQTFTVYAGNPNGNVAGVQGDPASDPKVFPTVVWDTTNTIWWVCSVTGIAALAVWVPTGDDAQWPYYCTQSGGTANAPVLTTPAVMDRLVAGTLVAWAATTGPNTGAMTVQVGAFGVKNLYKNGPAGPTPLLGGEVQTGNIYTARYDGVRMILEETALGTAALANASSATGTVAAVVGAGTVTPGNLPQFSDVAGSLEDSGTTAGSLVASAESVMYRLGEIF